MPPWPDGYRSAQRPVIPIEIQQRLSAGDLRPDHLAHKDGMIARFNDAHYAALDGGQTPGKQRNAGFVAVPIHAFKPALRFLRKYDGQIPLRFTQHVHAKIFSRSKVRKESVSIIDADQNQRRLHRHRGKRTHRQSVRRPVLRAHCSDSDSGSKKRARFAESFGIGRGNSA